MYRDPQPQYPLIEFDDDEEVSGDGVAMDFLEYLKRLREELKKLEIEFHDFKHHLKGYEFEGNILVSDVQTLIKKTRDLIRIKRSHRAKL